MASGYQKFLRKQISLAPLGVERRPDSPAYFCTPKGASVIGWAGVDGIHYCFVRGFGEMIFAVNPSNAAPDFVHPLASTFEDFLRLLLACGSADALEQAWMWEEARFAAYLQENQPDKDARASLDEIAEKMRLTPMENPWRYVKALQSSFDTSKIRFAEDFDEPDRRDPPPWAVYYDGNFWGHRGRGRAAREIPVGKRFDWAGRRWFLPSVYACGKGLVADFCMETDAESIRAFLDQWKFTDEDGNPRHFTQEERMLMDLANPTTLDFRAALTVNGKELAQDHGCGVGYNPLDADCGNDLEGRWAVAHYGLDENSGWMIWRIASPWRTKRPPRIQSLAVTMRQNHVAVPGARFTVEAAGDAVAFTHPQTGARHTLTVQDYERQTMPARAFGREDMDFPTHFHAMTYTVAPELPFRELSLSDCSDGDRPRRKENPDPQSAMAKKYGLSPAATGDAAAVGIIGGVRGKAEGVRCACSSLHFEPKDRVEWRLVFHEKQFEDKEIELLPSGDVRTCG